MNYGMIKKADIADGEGVRVSLFVSGCRHHCKECFQPETWDFSYGALFDEKAADEIIEALQQPYISGLTLLGGEPFEPENQREIVPFLREVKKACPKKTIWSYSGYLLEELWSDGHPRCEYTDEMLSFLDVLVDGEFQVAKKDISLRFRGSSNQRIIDVPRSLEKKEAVVIESLMERRH